MASPAYGAVLLSVYWPRKLCSISLGAAGDGLNRSSRLVCKLSVDLEPTAVLLSYVPLRNWMETRKLGWFASYGSLASCWSLGNAQLHIEEGVMHVDFSSWGCVPASVAIPVGIGGYPVRFNHRVWMGVACPFLVSVIARIVASTTMIKKNMQIKKYHLRRVRPSRPGRPLFLLNGPRPRHSPQILRPAASSLSSLRLRISWGPISPLGLTSETPAVGSGSYRG